MPTRLCSLLMLIAPAFAGEIAAEAPELMADRVVDRYAETYGVTGGVAAVVQGDKVLYRRAFGDANVEFDVPATPETLFQLSSTTKVFTGTLMAQLARDGLVDYEAPVRRYLPRLPEAWSDVLIADIMSHTSGLPEVLACDEPDDTAAAFECVGDMERPAGRREGFSYNQTNYMLAMQVIETVTGKPFAEVLQHEILAPAGMNSTIVNLDSRDVVRNRATGYYPDGDGGLRVREYTFPPYLQSAAGINSTLDDMISFARALLGEELLDAEGKARMWQAPVMNDGEPGGYAMGWELDAMRDGRQSAGHEGGMLTTFRVYPDEDLAVVFLTNGMTTPYGHDEVADMLALSFVGDIFDPADALGYRAKLAYLGDGVAGVKRVLSARELAVTNADLREISDWLAEEVTDIGDEESAAAILELAVTRP